MNFFLLELINYWIPPCQLLQNSERSHDNHYYWFQNMNLSWTYISLIKTNKQEHKKHRRDTFHQSHSTISKLLEKSVNAAAIFLLTT
jgi:hypothetical protein